MKLPKRTWKSEFVLITHSKKKKLETKPVNKGFEKQIENPFYVVFLPLFVDNVLCAACFLEKGEQFFSFIFPEEI